MDIYIYIGNAFLYLFLFLFIYRKVENNGKYIAMLNVAILFVASVCSVFYFESPLYFAISERGGNNISITALIYLFIGFVIYLYPISKLNFSGKIIYPYWGGKDAISIVIIVVGLLSVIPFIENLSVVLKMSAIDMAETYDLKQHEEIDTRGHLSTIGHFCNGIVMWLRYIAPILFFYAIATRRKWYVIMLSFLSLLSPVLIGMMSGGRGPLYGLLTILMLNFILFRTYFDDDITKKVLKIGVILGVLMVIILTLMTFARDEGETYMAINQITRYIGEGWVNFAETGWYTDVHTGGHSIFNGTGHTFMKSISDFFESRHWEQLSVFTHMRMYVYYTIIGDYYIDFGLIGGLLFPSLLALVFYKTVYQRPNHFSSIIIINLYAKLGLTGYGCFCYMNYAEFVLFTLFVYAICRLFEPDYK